MRESDFFRRAEVRERSRDERGTALAHGASLSSILGDRVLPFWAITSFPSLCLHPLYRLLHTLAFFSRLIACGTTSLCPEIPARHAPRLSIRHTVLADMPKHALDASLLFSKASTSARRYERRPRMTGSEHACGKVMCPSQRYARENHTYRIAYTHIFRSKSLLSSPQARLHDAVDALGGELRCPPSGRTIFHQANGPCPRSSQTPSPATHLPHLQLPPHTLPRRLCLTTTLQVPPQAPQRKRYTIHRRMGSVYSAATVPFPR